MIAAGNGHTEALAKLIAAGADVNGQDSQVSVLLCHLLQRVSVTVTLLIFSLGRLR
jgi:ankyrin repeat protein